jgi:hypothetical protein
MCPRGVGKLVILLHNAPLPPPYLCRLGEQVFEKLVKLPGGIEAFMATGVLEVPTCPACLVAPFSDGRRFMVVDGL